MSTAQIICYAVIQSIITVFRLCRLLTLRRSFLQATAILSVLTLLIGLCAHAIIGNNSGVPASALSAAAGFGFTLLSFDGSLKAKASAYLSGILISLAAVLGAELTARTIFGSTAPAAPSQMLFLDLFMILALAVLTTEKLRKKENAGLLLMMLLFSALHLAFLVIFFITCSTAASDVNCLMQLCFQLILYVLITVLYFNSLRLAELERREAEARRISEEMKENRRYFMLADSKFSEISHIRHDIQNHLSTARLLMEDNDSIGSAESIIDAIEQRLKNI